MLTTIKRRPDVAISEDINELPLILQRIYAQRGISNEEEINHSLTKALPPGKLLNVEAGVELIYRCMKNDQHILIVGDFDADGATSTALFIRALKSFGYSNASYLVPNRFEFGYGLTSEIVEVAAESNPALIITVDNGISSIEGVAAAKAKGIDVLITDHHLPGRELPKADVIINPNQNGDNFPSKHLAGVGVVFYVLSALRALLRESNWFTEKQLREPNLAQFLDIVAVGTVADVAKLDYNNRILVDQGLRRIRADKCCAGIRAMLTVSGKKLFRVSSTDLGFVVGPRLNAAGRLEDMSLGIECLLTDDEGHALELAKQLNDLNEERKQIEQQMQKQALEVLKSNHSIYDVIKNIGSEDIVLNCMKYKGRHIVIDEHTDCRDDFIVEDNGYRVMYKSSGTSKEDVPVLVSAKVSDFADIEDYYGGILVTTEIEGEAKFTLEQMDITLVLVDADGLYDMHNLMECDDKGRGKGSCEVHFDYTIMKGNGELPHIPKGQNGYVEALRSIRRNGKNGCVFIYVGGRNSYDKANRVREYRQCIFNMEHLKDGTTFGNGLGIMPKNVIHESGVNNLITGREGGVDSYWLVVDCIKKAKSVAKEILSVSRVVNKN